MTGIVISYRRADSAGITGRIFDHLEAHFGHDSVFMDIDNIPLGWDFRDHITDTLQRCDVLLAIIGPRWFDADGVRLQDETDWVRIEIESALAKKVPVIPVLIDNAHIPQPGQLPESLRGLAFRQAARVDSGVDFRQHMERLIRSLEQIVAQANAARAAADPIQVKVEVKAEPSPEPKPETVTPQVEDPQTKAAPNRKPLFAAAAAIGVLAVLGLVFSVLEKPSPPVAPADNPPAEAAPAQQDVQAPTQQEAQQTQPAQNGGAPDPNAAEKIVWDTVKGSNDVGQLQSYLAQYPKGLFVRAARAKIVSLTKAAPAAAAPAAAAPATTLNAQVQESVDSARAAEKQTRDKAAEARLVQTRAQAAAQQGQAAAQQAAAGANGYGVLASAPGAASAWQWQGQVVNNLANGFGTYIWTAGPGNGDHYEGEARNGQASGIGAFDFPGAGRYEGENSAGIKSGAGVFNYPSGDHYEGEFRADHIGGYGLYTGGAARSYVSKVGQFDNDKLTGYGIVYWKDGRVWIGNWKDDSLNGYGVKYDAQGHIAEQGLYDTGTLKTALTGN